MHEVKVNLGERSYVVTIGRGAISQIGQIVTSVRHPSMAVVVSNPTVARLYGDEVLSSLSDAGIRGELVVVAAGERSKTLATVRRVYDALLDLKVDRSGAVVALGGGVIGDLAGFAAATYMRGIDFYQVPTTLLAQVDASVGGKTGVDLPQGKNLIGAFHQPRAVVIDTLTLRTLPARELRCGLAEVIKHGIIYDQEFFWQLEQRARHLLSRCEDDLYHAVCRSVEIKRDVVQADERESGLRAILNFGHTIGHAVEVVTGYGKYRHGEAVAIGMVAEAFIAEREGYAEEPVAEVVAQAIAKMRLPVKMDASVSPDSLLRAIELDKKARAGEIRLALPTKIGRCDVFTVSRDAICAALEFANSAAL
ncbi:MAG: 3-dehydroquinate synthase [Armatimonadetes bacterium]|nr:3-dehydroquinate synthase [Armatimonadota bacterium]